MNFFKHLKYLPASFGWIVLVLVFAWPAIDPVEAQAVQPLLQTQTDFELLGIAWSPDGGLIAVGEPAGTIIFDTALQEVAHLAGNGIVSVDWNPQGTQLATGGGFFAKQGEVQIWERNLNSNTFTLETSFHNSHENVFFLTWSPDGTMLATASRDSWDGFDPIVFTIEIWNTDDWTLKTTLKHQYLDGYNNLSWSPDSARIAGAGTQYIYDGAYCSSAKSGFYIADVETGERLLFLGEDYPSSVDWSKDDVIAVNWPTLALYNPDNGEVIYDFTRASGKLKWHPDGLWLAYIAAEDYINIYSSHPAKFIMSVQGEPEFWNMDWNPDGTRLVAVTLEGTIQIWDTSCLVSVEADFSSTECD